MSEAFFSYFSDSSLSFQDAALDRGMHFPCSLSLGTIQKSPTVKRPNFCKVLKLKKNSEAVISRLSWENEKKKTEFRLIICNACLPKFWTLLPYTPVRQKNSFEAVNFEFYNNRAPPIFEQHYSIKLEILSTTA